MRFIHDNLYPLLAALIFVIAASSWFAAPGPATTTAIAPPEAAWSLPQIAQRDGRKTLETINTRNLFGTAIAEVRKEPEWRVLGIAMSGAERFVLLSHEDKPVATLKIGDALPDGAKIIRIERDRIFVMTADNQKHSYGINQNDQAK
jgi:hypothetical protein